MPFLIWYLLVPCVLVPSLRLSSQTRVLEDILDRAPRSIECCDLDLNEVNYRKYDCKPFSRLIGKKCSISISVLLYLNVKFDRLSICGYFNEFSVASCSQFRCVLIIERMQRYLWVRWRCNQIEKEKNIQNARLAMRRHCILLIQVVSNMNTLLNSIPSMKWQCSSEFRI